jgi:uncharacterized protein YjbI with pentapeptide repeats
MDTTALLTAYAEGKCDFRGSNLRGSNLEGSNLRGANLEGANLRGANLEGADLGGSNLRGSNLRGANLEGANLRGANLEGAYLRGAYLRGAYLRGANLEGANLEGADLGEQWIVQGPCRSDGYWFFLQKLTGDETPMVKAGCRYFSMEDARAHWQKTRAGTPLGDETFAILDSLEAIAKARGKL